MERYDLGNFDTTYTLEPYPGVRYVISRRGDTYDEDGGRNRHEWHWDVYVRDYHVDTDRNRTGSGWTDGYGLDHGGFPTAEDAFDHMRRNCRTPSEYAAEHEDRKARAPKTADEMLHRPLGRKAREG